MIYHFSGINGQQCNFSTLYLPRTLLVVLLSISIVTQVVATCILIFDHYEARRNKFAVCRRWKVSHLKTSNYKITKFKLQNCNYSVDPQVPCCHRIHHGDHRGGEHCSTLSLGSKHGRVWFGPQLTAFHLWYSIAFLMYHALPVCILLLSVRTSEKIQWNKCSHALLNHVG